uniref:Ribonuclease VapC n=1 Tax=Candidatus Kentrum sp. UNK TaxID=2126344 RepID=A0A451AF86_9GAMM|nr:MAG: hypothetical protein BECKUNK1418G_GA0071005_104922 [Candidatus Kentron sp. UNK]VFK71178.1 MAG: hypothetical protein BECKUNK1418H_GA0071006_105322 [Candidatus Kentron sp. UNK]
MHLLDTNIVIGLLKGDPASVALAEQVELRLEQCAVSQITRMELLSFQGITRDEERRINIFLAACHVCRLDERTEQEAIRLRRLTNLKLPDAIVAASALVRGATLLTLDQRMKATIARLGPDI